MRRRRNLPLLPMGIICLGIFILYLLGSFLFSGGQQAERVVDQFYAYEQDGDFSNSWELLHPDMKKKFEQGDYIQDRAHVFIGHFGADTFSYTIEEEDKVENWRMSKETDSHKVAYKFVVTQKYNGKYGSFSFLQDVYVVDHKGDWVIVWDYND
ncbi:hypothetical protein [Bacillus suaedaesalsae]|uniref:DUF4878 domain-containing protein n=1 Tax=Bacillus suaedaesalsae TaxID=2810349 RepID=A0ABS2DL84_9BACI|nr:hypothetical protein [Bacillus suaedaesalsae]MBM6619171.1 hypothetical protein [Bacillus suaedaesalsae]